MSAVLTLEAVSVNGLERPRVNAASFTVRASSITIVIGENGSGKSTLLDCCSGLISLDAGNIKLDDASLSALSPRERAQCIAGLCQQNLIRPHMPVIARIGQCFLPSKGTRHLLQQEEIHAIQAIAAELKIEHLLHRTLSELSGGERRRVHLATALAHPTARLFVLDEPFAGIDMRHQVDVLKAIKRRQENGAAFLISVHDMNLALHLGDQFVGLHNGQQAAVGDAHTFFCPEVITAIFGRPGSIIHKDNDEMFFRFDSPETGSGKT